MLFTLFIRAIHLHVITLAVTSGRIHEYARDRAQLVLVLKHIDKAEGKEAEHVDGERNKKLEEVAVVAPTDAVVHPRAVMVKHLHTEQL